MSSGEVVFAVGPGSGLAVEGAGFEAAAQDTDEPVSDFTRGRVVPDAAGAFGVVEGAGPRRGVQSGGGLPDRRPQRTRSHHPGELDRLTQADFRISIQILLGGAGGARTHDRRIMRTTAWRSPRSTCTDTTEPCHRWPSLHCMHGWLGPRTGPRPPQRAPDVNYGASPHTARDPPVLYCDSPSTGSVRGAQNGTFCRGLSSGGCASKFGGRPSKPERGNGLGKRAGSLLSGR
jgi:hypothetical protein